VCSISEPPMRTFAVFYPSTQKLYGVPTDNQLTGCVGLHTGSASAHYVQLLARRRHSIRESRSRPAHGRCHLCGTISPEVEGSPSQGARLHPGGLVID